MIPGSPIKIVLVDDPCHAKEPRRYLERHGYHVAITPAEAAMGTILQEWPDIIALATSGTSIAETCRDNPFLARKKVLICHD